MSSLWSLGKQKHCIFNLGNHEIYKYANLSTFPCSLNICPKKKFLSSFIYDTTSLTFEYHAGGPQHGGDMGHYATHQQFTQHHLPSQQQAPQGAGQRQFVQPQLHNQQQQQQQPYSSHQQSYLPDYLQVHKMIAHCISNLKILFGLFLINAM